MSAVNDFPYPAPLPNQPELMHAAYATFLAACAEIDRLRALIAEQCRCTNLYLNAGRGFGKSRESVGKNWNPECPVHPRNPRLQADADRSVEMQRLAAQSRAGTLPCRKCGAPIRADQHRFGSPESGYEHMEGECDDLDVLAMNRAIALTEDEPWQRPKGDR